MKNSQTRDITCKISKCCQTWRPSLQTHVAAPNWLQEGIQLPYRSLALLLTRHLPHVTGGFSWGPQFIDSWMAFVYVMLSWAISSQCRCVSSMIFLHAWTTSRRWVHLHGYRSLSTDMSKHGDQAPLAPLSPTGLWRSQWSNIGFPLDPIVSWFYWGTTSLVLRSIAGLECSLHLLMSILPSQVYLATTSLSWWSQATSVIHHWWLKKCVLVNLCMCECVSVFLCVCECTCVNVSVCIVFCCVCVCVRSGF